MFGVDLRQDRFMKVWRLTGDKVQATAAVIRRPRGFTAAIRYAITDGRARTWSWRGQQGALLTDREAALSILSIDRRFKTMPGTYLRVDFPQGSNRADQVVILMEYGLLELVPGADTPPDLEEEGCRS